MQYARVSSIMDSVRRIVRALRVYSRASERDVGLSGAQLFVLKQLASQDGLSINELAEKTLTHQSSVSVVVSRLAEQGYVVREPSARDARKNLVTLAPSGRKLIKKTPATAQERIVYALAALSPDEQGKLAQLLEAVVKHAGFDGDPATMFFEDDHVDRK